MFVVYGCVFFFFKQKTAYEMRISDWSSDVCSSDLRLAKATPEQVKAAANKWLSRPAFSLTYTPGERTEGGENRGGAVVAAKGAPAVQPDPIGRASCRERVCQYV